MGHKMYVENYWLSNLNHTKSRRVLNSGAPESETVPDALLAPVMLLKINPVVRHE